MAKLHKPRLPQMPHARRPDAAPPAERSWWERAQTTAMVLLFTGLIWWNANELVRTSRTFHLVIKAVQPAGVQVRIASGHEVSVTLSGSVRSLDSLGARLQAANGVVEYRVTENELRENPERIDASSREVVSLAAELDSYGINITESKPATISLEVDRLETVQMPVEVQFGAVEVQSVTVSPSQVTVTLPRRAQRAGPDRIRIDAEDPAKQWLQRNPGGDKLSLRLPVPGMARALTIEPAHVTVTGAIVQVFATQTKGPIQVQPAIPSSVQERFTVEAAQEGGFRTDVTLRGPRDDFATLSPEQIRAYVDVLTADVALAGQKITRRAVLILPRGFELVGEPPEITFQLVPRNGGAEGP